MADIFSTEEHGDTSEESNENVIDLSTLFNEDSEMTLKQESCDSELFTTDDLLVNPDDLLPPVVKLEKYANSDIVFNRLVVARNLLETLRLVHENNDDVARVINVLSSISEDYDPIVRTELMVQFPHIAAFCKEVKSNHIISQNLVPMLLYYLRDENNMVRKSSHSALLSLLEQGLIDLSTQTDKIWPLILHMTDGVNSEDIRTESIMLMSKIIVLIGSEEQFLDRLFNLCTDRSNNVRKACASTFGEICTAVGREITEELLLPKFYLLCEDSAWCVRKACAENFMPVSCIVSREIRCKELSSLYMILLSDQSRWVRVTAYQALGPFISTFAEPDKTGLYYSKDGILTIVDSPSFKVDITKQDVSDDTPMCNGDLHDSDAYHFIDGHSNDEWITTSNSCDNVVPLDCLAASHSASSVQSVSCQVGNYCTVIEVNSSNCAAVANKTVCQNFVVKKVQETELALGINAMSDECDRLHQSEEEFQRLWQEAANGDKDFVGEDFSVKNLNGDIDAVNNLNVSNKNLDSCTVSESKGSALWKSINVWDSITVNGLSLPELGVMNGPSSAKLEQCILSNAPKNTIETSSNSHSDDCTENESSISHEPSSNSVCEETDNTQSMETETMLKSPSDTSACNVSAFNNFQYWRDPLPTINIDEYVNSVNLSIPCAKSEPVSIAVSNAISLTKKGIGKPKRTSQHPCQEVKYTFPVEVKIDRPKDIVLNSSIPENKGEPPPKVYTAHDQDIIPPELLLQYLSMIDSAWAQTIDAEIARHCAYSLPAVALTLGRKYWPCLKETFDALTSDLQGFIMMWKVRRTVASALHQLAVILGPDITSKDLLPVFSRFVNDLDEVRVGILQHLFDFLKILRPQERVQFLPSLPQFLISNSDTDTNDKNWRFRLILAEQLVCIADLFEPQHVKDHLVSLSLTLIKDKVCEVRLAAVRVMAAVMKRMSQSPTQALTKAVLSELTEKFVHSPKYLHRQLYVYVCQEFIVENSLSADQFAEDALPQLLFLCWDRVPNVRIAIARCLVTAIWPLDTFSNPDSTHRELLLETIHTLQSDIDADVRYYANMVSTHECSCLQNGEFNNVGDSFV